MAHYNIKEILVPIDFSTTSEHVIAQATRLAKSLQAKLFLLHVTTTELPMIPVDYNIEQVNMNNQEITEEAEKKMQILKQKIKSEFGIETETHVLNGHVHESIIEFSKEKEVDLIIMGTHGASGYKELFIGSNAQRVVTLADIPVITMQKNMKDAGFKNILIPIDNSTHSREKVNIAMTIAELFDAEIHIIGLPDSEEENELKKFRIKLESVEQLVSAVGLKYSNTIIDGDNLAEEAVAYASDHNCDLIVINTGHESKLTGIFLGAFAQQIVNHSSIPVLSIKHVESHYSIGTPGYAV